MGIKKELKQLLDGGDFRSRTGLHEFAIRCITALLSRQKLLTATWFAVSDAHYKDLHIGVNIQS